MDTWLCLLSFPVLCITISEGQKTQNSLKTQNLSLSSLKSADTRTELVLGDRTDWSSDVKEELKLYVSAALNWHDWMDLRNQSGPSPPDSPAEVFSLKLTEIKTQTQFWYKLKQI